MENHGLARDSTTQNTQNTSKLILPICPNWSKDLKYYWKKTLSGVRSPWRSWTIFQSCYRQFPPPFGLADISGDPTYQMKLWDFLEMAPLTQHHQSCKWSTEGRNIRPKPKFFTIRPSALSAKILFWIFGLRLCLKNGPLFFLLKLKSHYFYMFLSKMD